MRGGGNYKNGESAVSTDLLYLTASCRWTPIYCACHGIAQILRFPGYEHFMNVRLNATYIKTYIPQKMSNYCAGTELQTVLMPTIDLEEEVASFP